MKKRPFTHLYVVTALSTFFFFLLTLYDPAYISEKIEAKTFDLRLALRSAFQKTGPPSDIAIVYIDEKSLNEIGRWPWKRDVMAQLVRKISSGGPKVIGLDIMLSERESEESDRQLSLALREAGNVVLPLSFVITRDQTEKEIEPPDFVSDSAFMKIKSVRGIAWRMWAVKAVKAVPPLPELARHSILGSVNHFPDLDGVVRWGLMYVCLADDCYPHFAMQVARTVLNVGMKEVVLFGGSGIDIGGHFLRTDLSGRVLINYQGGGEEFPSVSASDVLAGRAPEGFFKGKVVMVGASAFATYDQKMTPFSPDTPGVSIHAAITDNILRTGFLKKSPGLIELLSILFTGILFGLVFPRLAPLAGFGVALLCVFLYTGIGVAALVYKNVWINLTYPLANMLIIYNGQTFIRFLFEERKAREIRRIFSRYVSPRIVEVLIDNQQTARSGGGIKEVTILFADIVGFTALSEKMGPEDVVRRLNEYFTEMVKIIFEFDGTINKFIGDGIMACWGAPIEQSDHAVLAVKCSMRMVEKLGELRDRSGAEGQLPIDMGIGINTGNVLVGNIGAEGMQMDYTVIGDHVNLASRIEGLTRKYHTHILISEYTLSKIRADIEGGLFSGVEIRGLGKEKVRGREHLVAIYEILRCPGARSFITEPSE